MLIMVADIFNVAPKSGTAKTHLTPKRIGIIGGSGLYRMEGLTPEKWVKITTPFGRPSGDFLLGDLAGREVVFLPRHKREHRLLPGELEHRANSWAMKQLGVAWIISVGAVGSLQAQSQPRDLVLIDQFVDHIRKSSKHNFFGQRAPGHG